MANNITFPHPRHHEFSELLALGISALRISGGLSEGQLWQTMRALQILDIEIADARDLLPATSPLLQYEVFITHLNRIGGGLSTQQSKAMARWCVEVFKRLQTEGEAGSARDNNADMNRKLASSGLPLQTKLALEKTLWPLPLVSGE